jgi:hypothetical protein
MAICSYCGKSAGLFHKFHAECKEKYDGGKAEILHEVGSILTTAITMKALSDQVDSIAANSFISASEKHSLIIKGWMSAILGALGDGMLTDTQDNTLQEAKKVFELTDEELRYDDEGTYTKIVKSAVLRELMDGVVPNHFKSNVDLPINLQKGEKLIWAFNGCDYYEDKMHHENVGRTQGFSVRVMKGLYYRVGAFEGHQIDRTERVHLDKGLFAITNKNIYFAGSVKSFRVPYQKIVSFQSYSDGIGFVRDASNAKPQTFVTGDGWFTYNLITNLSRLIQNS